MVRQIKKTMNSAVLQKNSDKVHSIRYDLDSTERGPVRSIYLLRDALEDSGKSPAKIRVTVEVVE